MGRFGDAVRDQGRERPFAGVRIGRPAAAEGLSSQAIARYSHPESCPETMSSFVDLELPGEESDEAMQPRPVYVAAIDLSCRVFAFLSGPPDYGAGQLDTRRYGEQYASKGEDADCALLPEQTPFY
ncbi:hypothetical protein D8674_006190 [Pyrus ussuriensis x Pyrus communis]|uniref:Uncharacterized protein n=1 Tax=Pyrus ussuriensis x Pyrus communis TaxID=2448454 RepID=A0A5N5FTX7_9ROSA|nr:hypothetical protein D8674_006190 [Pyrus ussuriensis x Pyrus communis]